jgi:hypothetical protein
MQKERKREEKKEKKTRESETKKERKITRTKFLYLFLRQPFLWSPYDLSRDVAVETFIKYHESRNEGLN